MKSRTFIFHCWVAAIMLFIMIATNGSNIWNIVGFIALMMLSNTLWLLILFIDIRQYIDNHNNNLADDVCYDCGIKQPNMTMYGHMAMGENVPEHHIDTFCENCITKYDVFDNEIIEECKFLEQHDEDALL